MLYATPCGDTNNLCVPALMLSGVTLYNVGHLAGQILAFLMDFGGFSCKTESALVDFGTEELLKYNIISKGLLTIEVPERKSTTIINVYTIVLCQSI